jgi:hypothetical protein
MKTFGLACRAPGPRVCQPMTFSTITRSRRILLAMAAVCLAGGLLAAPIAVFGEKDFYVIDSAGPKDAERAAFFEGYKADVGRGAALESALDLVSPPEWGKTVSAATHGRIRFHPAFPGGFACRLSLENLLPDHDYILTLNGNPSRAGNGLLPSKVPGNEQERYYDFLIVRTDTRGHYDASLGVFLKHGSYDVRCYVKDTADFKIVLFRDFFKFEVT